MTRARATGHVAALMLAIAAEGRADAQVGPRIPLCPGVKVVTAVSQPDGDYESIKTIESVADAGLRLKYSSERQVMDLLDGPSFKRQTSYRVVRKDDAQSSSTYLQTFSEHIQEAVPGTTSIGTSADVLRALKSGREVEFGIFNAGLVGQVSLDRNEHPNLYDYELRAPIRRVGAGTVAIPVLVDGQRATLQAIHAAGDFFGDKAEFFFLDDAANPLTLKFRIGIGAISKEDANLANQMGAHLKAGGDRDVLEVVKITTQCVGAIASAPATGGAGAGAGDGTEALEEALEKTGRADVYDIFFGFGSDRIREESEPTLKRIGALLTKHTDWRLNIEGHTDSVASDAANLELSKRRAAAVRKALVDRHGIASSRLATDGYGESRPKDTNDTLAGRARNRRVELVRTNLGGQK
jgi:outer membrane protein OmpA-like peptidoglycan-associated protein